MKTPAIIASLTIVGSIAYAAGQGVAGKQSPAMPRGTRAHSMQQEMPAMAGIAKGAEADCPPGDPLGWLSQVPQIIQCATNANSFLVAVNGSAVDVNGDGVLEYYGRVPFDGTDIVINGIPSQATQSLWFNRIDHSTQLPTAIRDSLEVVPPSLGQWVLATFPAATSASVSLADVVDWNFGTNISGWRDMDGDGDLDYLARLYVAEGASSFTMQIWFENIGFEKPAPPVAADLNRDGRVDGADLGMLLVAWGPNP
jgi:hypothetical protein